MSWVLGAVAGTTANATTGESPARGEGDVGQVAVERGKGDGG